VWTLNKLENAYSLLSKHTQLSAWALAKTSLETRDFTHQLGNFVSQSDVQHHELMLRYDILWSRYDTFLTSDETRSLRESNTVSKSISHAFEILKGYENAVISDDKKLLSQMLSEMQRVDKQLENLLIIEFTNRQATERLAKLDESKQLSYAFISCIVLLIIGLSYWLYRDSKKQHFLAWHDPLTHLPNRNSLINVIRNHSPHQDCLLILMDINHFQELNASMGYEVGDNVLKHTAETLRDLSKGPHTFCARMGGDEFALVCTRPPANIDQYCERIWQDIYSQIRSVDATKHLDLTFGVAALSLLSSQPSSTKRLIHHADTALSIAKTQQKRQLIFDAHVENEFKKRRRLTEEIESLLDDPNQTQLYLCYQPIMHSPTQEKLGCEALIRWEHPTFGFIRPDYLIGIIEEHGFGDKFALWSLRQIRALLTGELASWVGHIEISMNLSDSIFTPTLARKTAEEFSRNPILLECLVYEITETMTLADIEHSQKIIQQINQLGIRCALDDFGTGWSSLFNLSQLPFTKVKIDRSFVTDIHQDEKKRIFVQSIVSLSHRLGIIVVAEGIEKHDELVCLQSIGVDEYQGYYFAKPLQKQAFIRYCEHFFKQSHRHMIR
jgi:diguanylate cyclase (GGDEF)-like protein